MKNVIKINKISKCLLSLVAVVALGMGSQAFGMDIFTAVRQGNIVRVQEIIKDKSFDVNKVDNFGCTPLYWACYNNNLEMVKLLLDNGAKESINKAYRRGRTTLYWACGKNNLEMVKLLLPLCTKETINKADNNGLTPLYYACRNNNLEIVKLLLPLCTKETINKVDNYDWTQLYWACMENNLEIVKLLLEWGANVDQMALDKAEEKAQDQNLDAERRAIATKILNTLNLARRFDAYKKAGAFFNLTPEEQNDKNLSEFAGKLPKSVRAKALDEELSKSFSSKFSKFAKEGKGQKYFDTNIKFSN